MRFAVGVVFFLITLVTQVSQAGELSIDKVKITSEPAHTRIFIPVPEGTGYVAKDIDAPPRLVLNLFPVRINFTCKEIRVEDRFIQKICLLKDSENVVKAAVDLNTSEYIFDISSQSQPSAVIIQIRPPGKDIIPALLGLESIETEENPPSFGPWQKIPKKKVGNYRIVIDPGHGGKDPGAIGPSGTREKDITLAIARKVAELLNQNSEFQVYLTREGDEFIPLDRRTEIANLLGGDLFVSIHTNATWSSRAKGIETFYNSRYPYGEGAKEVAMRENAALGSGDLPSTVKNIIWDLIQNQYRQESKELARIVQEKIVRASNTSNRGVKSAPFYVLRGANMPAILVEVGFISNPWEERKLKNAKFQELIARGIYQGIVTYINSLDKKKTENP